MDKKLRSVFMGTPDFSVPCLRALCEITDVVAVITQPDKPKGRGKQMQPTPVKIEALERNIPVYQPAKVKTPEFTAQLRDMKPDIIIVVAFGQILSQEILDIPPLGCVNVHASLLPKYRGAAPIHWCIIDGETETGVTTMYMEAGLDTGDMLLKSHVDITPDMTTSELHDILMEQGSEVLKETVLQIAAGTIKREKQDDSLTCYAKMLNKETGHIDWTWSAARLHNLIRGLNSYPGAWSTLDGKAYKIWKSRVAAPGVYSVDNVEAGQVIATHKKGFAVQTGNGVLEILEIQPPSKKKMGGGDFVRGHGVSQGEIFGK